MGAPLLRVADLADAAHVSRRQLGRCFRSTVGLAPKAFSQVIRFQQALAVIRQGGDWEQVGFRCGFYDQPHLIREVERVSGLTPTAVRQRLTPTGLKSFFNGASSTPARLYDSVYL